MAGRKFLLCVGYGLLGLAGSVTHAAGELENLVELRTAVQDYVALQYQNFTPPPTRIDASPLDTRLRLTKCDTLDKRLVTGVRTVSPITVALRCTAPKPWTLYIPVRITIEADVVTTREPLPLGTRLTPAHLTTTRQNIAFLPGGYFLKSEEVVGKVLKRAAAPGTPLTPAGLRQEYAIKQGEEVIINAQLDNMVIRSVGHAISNGSLGDLIRVRNVGSKRVVEGIVTATGQIAVRME